MQNLQIEVKILQIKESILHILKVWKKNKNKRSVNVALIRFRTRASLPRPALQGSSVVLVYTPACP